MSAHNSSYRAFISGDRLIAERLNAFRKGIRNHVLTGFKPVAGGGLSLSVGSAGTNVAYINGFEVYSGSVLECSLDGDLTHDIYLVFTYTEDTVSSSYSTITPTLEALLTTQSPVNENYLKIAQVTTGATQITDVSLEWGSYFYLSPAAFGREDLYINDWVLPAANPATVAKVLSSGAIPFSFYQAQFADGADTNTMYWPYQVPWDYSSDQPDGFPRLRVHWKANSTNTALKARLEASVAAYTPAVDAGSFNVKSLSTWAGQSPSQLGTTARRLNATFVEIENLDGLAGGDTACIGFRRDPTHGDDDLAGVDVEVVNIAFEYQIGD